MTGVTMPLTSEPTPSAYQQAIFDFVLNGAGDGMVNAVAGSGKTTTLVMIAKLIKSGRAQFLAFNKHIALELEKRLVGTTMQARTIHSFGYSAVRRAFGTKVKMVDGKYEDLAKGYIDMHTESSLREMLFSGEAEIRAKAELTIRQRVAAQVKLINLARLTLVDPKDFDAMRALMVRYDIEVDTDEIEEVILKGVKILVGKGIDLAIKKGQIDFTDMVFLPVELGLPVDKYDWQLVDECQDLNTAQRRLVLMGRAPGGRIIWVGDEKQAIMGFSGADTASYWNIQKETDATMLDLFTCYRCPARHIALAQMVVPHIQARENAPAGTVLAIHEKDATKQIGEGALVLSRTTAPLVKLCIKLIKERKPARVRGRDIGKGLTDLAKKVGSKKSGSFENNLRKYEEVQVAKLMAKKGNHEEQIATLKDKVEALLVCWNDFTPKCRSIADLCANIDAIFADESASIWLSTIHRAKGLEADVVFILNPKKLPFSHPKQQPEDVVQEWNILYVALTRSKNTLVFIHEDGDKLPTEDAENLTI